MPFYELECKKCGYHYDIMSTMADQDKNTKKAECPECSSKAKNKVISLASFSFSNPVGTDKYNNSHDYRYHHNMNKEGGTRDQRKAAAAASHVGDSPYNAIDDISSGKNFGEVK